MRGVLFVCTGNIFRSVTAEYALRHALGPDAGIEVGSAGTVAEPAQIAPWIQAHLRSRGYDVGAHRQRRVEPPLIADGTFTVAMGLNHQQHLADRFGHRAPLFNEICFGKSEGVLDVDEMFPDWRDRKEEAMAYGLSVVDYICDSMPAFLEGLRRTSAWRDRFGDR